MKHYTTTIITMVIGIVLLALVPIGLMLFVEMDILELILVELPILIAPLLIGVEQLRASKHAKEREERREIEIALLMWLLLIFITALFIYSRTIMP